MSGNTTTVNIHVNDICDLLTASAYGLSRIYIADRRRERAVNISLRIIVFLPLPKNGRVITSSDVPSLRKHLQCLSRTLIRTKTKAVKFPAARVRDAFDPSVGRRIAL